MSADLHTFEFTVFIGHQEVPGRQMDLSQREIYHSGDKFISHQHPGNKHIKSCMTR